MVAHCALAVVVRFRAAADYVFLSSCVVKVGDADTLMRPSISSLLIECMEMGCATSFEVVLVEVAC
jgi:hypothetical protein